MLSIQWQKWTGLERVNAVSIGVYLQPQSGKCRAIWQSACVWSHLVAVGFQK